MKREEIREEIIYHTAFIETALDDPEHISVDGYGEKLHIGLTKKQQELKLLQDKIKILKKKGLTNKSISQKLSIPLKTLERHITKMRKNNVL